jgi:hypothetical protein
MSLTHRSSSARVTEAGSAPDYFAKVPILIAEDLKAKADEDPTGAGILGVLVESVKTYLKK